MMFNFNGCAIRNRSFTGEEETISETVNQEPSGKPLSESVDDHCKIQGHSKFKESSVLYFVRAL